MVQGQVVEVSYNIQAAVGAQYNLIVATHTINSNDRDALSAIVSEAGPEVGKNRPLGRFFPTILFVSLRDTNTPKLRCIDITNVLLIDYANI